jgi:hypothetical protein
MTEKITIEDITIIILLIGEASGVFAGFCPSWFTVSSPFFHDQDAKAGNVKRIRWGEAAATGIVIATGAAVSVSTGKKIPLLASALISGIFVGGYEYMIANPSKDDGNSSSAGFTWQRSATSKAS